MYQQRAVPDLPALDASEPWPVRIQRTDGSEAELPPRPGDWYVAVDDLAYGRVVFQAAPWPSLDGSGRLAFEDVREIRTATVGEAQAAVDAARLGARQDMRPLRIGDVFWVSGPGLPDAVGVWRIRADVTRQAREAAKLALFSAVAPRLDPEQEQRLPPEPEAGEADEAGGAGAADGAFPAI